MDIGYAANKDAVAVMRKATLPFMYAGAMFDVGLDELAGDMIDDQGQSRLFDISIDEKKIQFTKQYLRHTVLGSRSYIFYVFDRREENTWVGTWRHQKSESDAWGPTRCVITDLRDSLLHKDVADFIKKESNDF